MPYALWRLSCCTSDHLLTADDPDCPRCFQRATFVRWELFPGEKDGLFFAALGLQPAGPHVAMANRLFRPLRIACTPCGGRGLTGDERGWRICYSCEGGGGFWAGSEADLAESYRSLLRKHPRAVAPAALPPFQAPVAPAPATPPAPERPARAAPAPAPSSSRAASRPKTPPRPSRSAEAAPRPKIPPGPSRSAEAARARPLPAPPDERPRAAILRAFIAAEAKLGTDFLIKGRGHCRRVSLRSHLSRLVSHVTRSWEIVTPHRSTSPLRLFPLAIVQEAADSLGIEASELIGQEYR